MMTIIGFLRGINVGGHHKVPMAALRDTLTEMGFENVRTLLNSGNVVFEAPRSDIKELEKEMEDSLSKSIGFPIPVILTTQEEILDLVDDNPFETINVHKDIRLYVSFLKDAPVTELNMPYFSADKAYQIISVRNKIILSVLDLTTSRTTKAMEDLEKLFGKNITTRNWNTIVKVANL